MATQDATTNSAVMTPVANWLRLHHWASRQMTWLVRVLVMLGQH